MLGRPSLTGKTLLCSSLMWITSHISQPNCNKTKDSLALKKWKNSFTKADRLVPFKSSLLARHCLQNSEIFCAKKLFLQDYFNVSIRNAPLDFVGRVDAICHRDFRWMTNNWRDARAAWWWCNADRRNEIVEQKSDSRTVCSWASSS